MHHTHPRDRARRRPGAAVALALSLALLALLPSGALAQTDYYNTDAGRPIRVEDATAIERRALELQVAPLRVERSRGIYTWGIEPEVAVGLLPRTQLEIGAPLVHVDRGIGGGTTGLAGLELSALHNLNVESRLPAFGIVADVLLPVGPLAPERAYPSLKGIATRTFTWARFHANAQYTFGSEADAGGAHGELSRWMGGVAADRTFPLQSALVTVELVARQPLAGGTEWSSAAGTRYQLSPRVAADAGAGYRFTGDDTGWYVTFGAAVSVGLPWRAR